MAMVKTGSITADQAREVSDRNYQITSEISRAVCCLPLDKAEELLQMVRDFVKANSVEDDGE